MRSIISMFCYNHSNWSISYNKTKSNSNLFYILQKYLMSADISQGFIYRHFKEMT